MPSFSDVGAYLDATHLEAELSDAVAECVEQETPQPLAAIADRLYERAAAAAVDWDYKALTTDLRTLINREHCGPQFVQLSFADAAVFSAALGGGRPNAALRFIDRGEGTFVANARLATHTVPLLEPLKAKYPNISRADLWAHAANVAIATMGGPEIHTRFGRRDAASSAESVASAEGRLPDDLASGEGDEHKAAHLRDVFGAKGFDDREIVALCGRHTVGRFEVEGGVGGGAWTADPQRFDNTYFAELLSKQYELSAAGTAGLLLRCPSSATIMLPTDHAIVRDAKLRIFAERYATDQSAFCRDFGSAWSKLQELGCERLAPHPTSLTYASSCVLPCEWLELPLITRRELTHNTTIYGFALPKAQQLQLPACASVLVKAPNRRRGRNSIDDEGAEVTRPYVPISDPTIIGKFELLVKRYEGGSVSSHLYGLSLGSKVAFKHVASNVVEVQYPFSSKRTITMLAGGTGITPMCQALYKILGTPGDERKVVLLYSSRSPSDILLNDELDTWARTLPHRLTLVHVLGSRSDDALPSGWKSSASTTAEAGWIDRTKIEKYAFPPAKDTLVFVCGPPPMYEALCGSRDSPDLREGSVLGRLGYSPGMVAKL